MTDNSPAQSAINQLVMGDLSAPSAPACLVSGHVDASALLRQAAIDASLDLPECRGFEDLSFGGSGESLSGKVAFLSVDNDHLVRSIGQAFDLGEDGPNATVKALLNLRGAQAAVIVVDARRAPNNLALITALDMAQSRSCGALRLPPNTSFHIVAGENNALLVPSVTSRTRAVVLSERGDCFVGNPPRATRVDTTQLGAQVPASPAPSGPRP